MLETIISWIWDDVIYAVYKRRGWLAAALVLLSPFLLLAFLAGVVWLIVR